MRSNSMIPALAAVALLLLPLIGCTSSGTGAATPAAGASEREAEPVSWSQVGRILRDADAALLAGDWQRAEMLYLRVADGRPRGDRRRARALWGAAIAEIGQPASQRELGLARARLDALLTAYPDSDEAPRARALRALLSGGAPAPTARAARGDGVETDEARKLRLKVQALERELAAARATLAEKEAALERLKQAIVGDG